MDPQNTEPQKTSPTVANIEPVKAMPPAQSVPVNPEQAQNPVQNEVAEEQEEPKKPIFKEWTFWLLVNLVIVLLIIGYFAVNQILLPPLSAKLEINGQTMKVHITRLNAPTLGFVAVQAELAGFPQDIINVSPQVPATSYRDIYIPINYDETHTFEYYTNMMNTTNVYVSFYKDVNGDHNYEQEIDTVIPRDILGRKMQVLIAKGGLK